MSQPTTHPDAESARLLDQLAAEQGDRVLARADELAGDLWESDDELDEFLAFVRRERDANLA